MTAENWPCLISLLLGSLGRTRMPCKFMTYFDDACEYREIELSVEIATPLLAKTSDSLPPTYPRQRLRYLSKSPVLGLINSMMSIFDHTRWTRQKRVFKKAIYKQLSVLPRLQLLLQHTFSYHISHHSISI